MDFAVFEGVVASFRGWATGRGMAFAFQGIDKDERLTARPTTSDRKADTTMKLKTFTAAVFALALVVMSALHAAASGPATPLTLLYYPSTGKLILQNTTTGTGSYQSFEVLTLGNGTYGATTPGEVGYLTRNSANLSGIGASFTTSNTSENGDNGLYSQAAAGVINGLLTGGMVLQPWTDFNAVSFAANPDKGPVGTFYDLGDIGALNMSQSDIDTRFITNFDTSPNNQLNPGKFQVSYGANLPTQLGAVMVANPVPEPSTYAMAFAGLAMGGFKMWRRRKLA